MIKRTALLGTTAVLSAIIAMPAHAQSFGDDEIIVTATKRQQTLQETPVAVTVVGSDLIEKARIQDIGDLQSVVPTLRVSQLQNSGNTSFSLRGFGNGTNNVGIEPAIGVFIDGVYRSRAAASINNLPNLERVEVLPGPQSALFGKNASGGVISIVTSAPSFEQTGHVEAGIGNNNLFEAKGFYSNAIADNAAFSIGAGFEKADGYFDIEGAADNNEIDRYNLRGQLLLEPSDALSLRLIADYNVIDEMCCGTAVGIEGPLSTLNRSRGSLPTDSNPYAYIGKANQDANNVIKDKGLSLQADYDLDNHTVTSITAYRTNEWFYDSDSDFSSSDVLRGVFQDVDTDTFTQELRLTSNLGGQFEYMVGAYYFAEDVALESGAYWGDDARTFIASLLGAEDPGVDDLTPTEEVLAGFDSLLGIGRLTGTDSSLYFAADLGSTENFEQEDRATSLFGTFDYKPTERFTVTAGLNYTNVEKDVSLAYDVNDPYSFLEFDGVAGTRVAVGTILGEGADINGDDVIDVNSFISGFGIDPTATGFNPTAAFGSAFGQTLGTCFNPAAPTPTNSVEVYIATVCGVAAGSIAQQFASSLDENGTLESLAGLQFLTPSAAFPNDVENGSTSDDAVTWSLRGSYELNDNWNIFAGAATGFKSSSWNLTRNSRPFATDQTALEGAGEATANQTYGTRFAAPEESTVFEIGAKARFEQGAFNITLFDQSIENFQATIFQDSAFFLSNAEEQSVQGFEFDGVYTPNDSWQFNLGGAYLDAVYDKFSTAFEGEDGLPVDLSGVRPAGIPELTISSAVTYNHEFGNNMSAFVRAEHDYQNEAQVVDNLPQSLTREVSSVNASIGVDFGNDISLLVWGRNITDDEYPTSGFPTPLISSVEDSIGVPLNGRSASIYPNQPATYGASVRYSF